MKPIFHKQEMGDTERICTPETHGVLLNFIFCTQKPGASLENTPGHVMARSKPTMASHIAQSEVEVKVKVSPAPSLASMFLPIPAPLTTFFPLVLTPATTASLSSPSQDVLVSKPLPQLVPLPRVL